MKTNPVLGALLIVGGILGGSCALLTVVGLVLSGKGAPSKEGPGATTPVLMPQDEEAFCAAIKTYGQRYSEGRAAGANELKLSRFRSERAEAIRRAVPSGAPNIWRGTLGGLSTTSDGKAAVLITLPCGAVIGTWNNSISDIGDGTLIPQSNPLYGKLEALSEGARVSFSAKLLAEPRDGYRESSMTEQSSMTEPKFVAHFTDVSRAP